MEKTHLQTDYKIDLRFFKIKLLTDLNAQLKTELKDNFYFGFADQNA